MALCEQHDSFRPDIDRQEEKDYGSEMMTIVFLVVGGLFQSFTILVYSFSHWQAHGGCIFPTAGLLSLRLCSALCPAGGSSNCHLGYRKAADIALCIALHTRAWVHECRFRWRHGHTQRKLKAETRRSISAWSSPISTLAFSSGRCWPPVVMGEVDRLLVVTPLGPQLGGSSDPRGGKVLSSGMPVVTGVGTLDSRPCCAVLWF